MRGFSARDRAQYIAKLLNDGQAMQDIYLTATRVKGPLIPGREVIPGELLICPEFREFSLCC